MRQSKTKMRLWMCIGMLVMGLSIFGCDHDDDDDDLGLPESNTLSGTLVFTQGDTQAPVGVFMMQSRNGNNVTGRMYSVFGAYPQINGQLTDSGTATMTLALEGDCPGTMNLTATLNNTVTLSGSGTNCNGPFSLNGNLGPVTCTSVTEQEPNDSHNQFQNFGAMTPGRCLTLAGNLNAEEQDTFGVRVTTPQTIMAILEYDDPAAGFAVALAGDGMTIIACQSAASPKICSAMMTGDAATRFLTVSNALRASGSYTLRVVSIP